ncbi:MAG: hypothetical protein QXU20_00315 [Candidatus Woesearchaeota archaeon]
MEEVFLDFNLVKIYYDDYKKTRDFSLLEKILNTQKIELASFSPNQKISCCLRINDERYTSKIKEIEDSVFENIKRDVANSVSREFGIVLNPTEYGFLYGLPFLGQKVVIKKDEGKFCFFGYYESIPIMCYLIMEVLERVFEKENK